MSEENVELVRRVCDQWAQGDLRAEIELFDPEIDFESDSLVARFTPDVKGAVTAKGPEGIAEFMREYLPVWRNWRYVADEFHDAGDKVLVDARQTATGRQSGVEVEQRVYSIWTVRGGKFIGLKFTRDRAEALEAAGLSE